MRSETGKSAVPPKRPGRVVGRYSLHDKIASGGMASVHFGRLIGAIGFSRTVAIKHLHPNYSSDAEFVSMFVDEARLSARIQHPNVAVPLDVVLEEDGEIFLVMEYIHGETLAHLLSSARSAKVTIPLSVSAGILSGALHGLHAAHEAVDEQGAPLGIVHRDISPQNIIVGADGVPRVLDFGVAKAVSRCQSTHEGQLKGKLAYMAPEQMRSGPVDRRVDIFAAGIVLWEALAHKRLFKPEDPATALAMVLSEPISAPSIVNKEVPRALDQVVMKALERDIRARFQTAREFADAIEEAIPLASSRKVGDWVQRLCSQTLTERAVIVSRIERSTTELGPAEEDQSLQAKHGVTFPSVVDANASTAEQSGVSGPNEPNQPNQPNQPSTVGRGEIVLSPSPELQRAPSSRLGKTTLVVAAVLSVVVAVGILRFSRRTELVVPDDVRSRRLETPSRPLSEAIRPPAPPEEPKSSPPALAGVREANVETGTANRDTVTASHPAKIKGRRSVRARIRSTVSERAQQQAPQKDCDPPYSIDLQGIRRIKPQCR